MKFEFSPFSLAAGIILGVLLSALWLYGQNVSALLAPGVPVSDASTTPALEGSPSGAVSVADQPAGDSVTVNSVTVPPPGVWVAVREMDGDALGNVLGALRVLGPRTTVVVPLLRATVPGEKYAVELYRNESDTFSPDMSVYVDFDTGDRVVAYFSTNTD